MSVCVQRVTKKHKNVTAISMFVIFVSIFFVFRFSSHLNLIIIRLNCPLFRDEHWFSFLFFLVSKLNWHWSDLTVATKNKTKNLLCICIECSMLIAFVSSECFYTKTGIGHLKWQIDVAKHLIRFEHWQLQQYICISLAFVVHCFPFPHQCCLAIVIAY